MLVQCSYICIVYLVDAPMFHIYCSSGKCNDHQTGKNNDIIATEVQNGIYNLSKVNNTWIYK